MSRTAVPKASPAVRRTEGSPVSPPIVLPAQAGTQKVVACGGVLDPRLRGNDGVRP